MSTTQTGVDVQILVADHDVTPIAVISGCSFQMVAGAQPGTCTVVLREPRAGQEGLLDFHEGHQILFVLDGNVAWRGFLFTIDYGYAFNDDAELERRWTLSGVDLNILFDKLILYNHDHPTRSLDGGGTYHRVKTEGGYIVSVPQHTMDRDYIWAMVGRFSPNITDQHIGDVDINLANPIIDTVSLVAEVGQINPDGRFAPPTPGLTWRAFMQDVSANVNRSTPGSVIWYIDPEARLVYHAQDTNSAAFSFGDNEDGVNMINVKNLAVTTDISRIKNDVLTFTGNLNPDPASTQSHLLYRHVVEGGSVQRYGRFQYSEVLSTAWLQASIDARANKIVIQEGQAAMRATFTMYTPGLYPGQLATIHSSYHTFTYFDPTQYVPGDPNHTGIISSDSILLPVRSIDVGFLNATTPEYRVTCSFDTQDPWGLLLALKRPPARGLVQPPFQVIDRTKGGPVEPAETFTLVKEYPRSLSGNRWQCSYAYIRYSMVVYIGGLRQVSVPEEGTTVGFIERDPDSGIFYMDKPGKPYVEYHVWHNLETENAEPPPPPEEGGGTGSGGDPGGGGGTTGSLVPATAGALAQAIADASNGDTLTLRGGNHVLAGQITTSKSLTLQNYAGEQPVITWNNTTRNNGIYFTGSGPFVIRGINFTASSDIHHDANGSAMLENDGGNNLTVEDCTFTGHANMDDHQQFFYQRYGTNTTVRRCTFVGNGTHGSGFHQYPADASDPHTLVEDSLFYGFGYECGVTSDSKITVRNSVFNNNHIAVQIRNSGTGSIITGNSGVNNDITLDDQVSVSESGNTWT